MRQARSRQPRRIESSCANEAKGGRSFLRSQAVTDAVNGMNNFRRPVDGDFLAQSVDVYLDKVRVTVEIRIPDVLDDFAATDDFRGFGEQEFEKGKLLGGQGDRFARPRYPAPM